MKCFCLISNCFTNVLNLDAFCPSAEQNRTNRVDWVPLARLSSVIELTSSIHRTHPELTQKFQFDYARLGLIEFDWFLFGFVRLAKPGVLQSYACYFYWKFKILSTHYKVLELPQSQQKIMLTKLILTWNVLLTWTQIPKMKHFR